VLWDGVKVNSFSFTIRFANNVHLHRCILSQGFSVNNNTPFGSVITALNSAIEISGSTVTAGLQPLSGSTVEFKGSVALELHVSRCVAVASSFTGGRSQSGSGGEGVLASRSQFLALRTTVTGGAGSTYAGGTGILCGFGSVAYFEGGMPVGGAGSPPGPASSGPGIQINANSTPSAGEIRGEQEVGKTIRFALDAKPNSLGALLMATQPTLVPLEPLTLGSFLSGWVLSIGPLMVPSTGTAEWSLSIPATYPLGETYYWQFLTLEPGNTALWVTNSFALHVNR
jgi:hypothetical protein